MWKLVLVFTVVVSSLFITPSEANKCPKNETLDPCFSSCPPRYCGVNIAAVSCPEQTECKPGCRCKDGFLRNATGFCICESDCPKCDEPNKIYDVCIDPCPRNRCDVDERLILCAPPPQPGDPNCKAGCRCADGFVRTVEGNCVTRDQCPPVCGKDEVSSECIQGDCLPKTCSQLGYSIKCPSIDPRNCTKGCLCKVGYVRAANKTCIPKEKCPSCGGDPNAVSGCGTNCGRLCSNYKEENVICPLYCKINGCDCKQGYVEDDSTGKCVLPKQCVSCGGDFNAKPGCDKNATKRCPGPKPAETKCYNNSCECKDGFVYDPKPRKCVRPGECTPVCGKNEVYSECTNGGCQARNCSQLGQLVPCVKLDPDSCIKGCVCEEGYLRTRNGTCVLEKDCDTPICRKNEVYDGCANGGCQKRNCSQVGQPDLCIDPIKCIGGCVCQEGYLRLKNGTCVRQDQCPPLCPKPHEIYDPCPRSCPPQTCDSIGKVYPCPKLPSDPKYCQPDCRCEDGYYRNFLKECISKSDCLKCPGPNEYFSCGVACDNVCATLKEQNQSNCPIKNKKCNPQCYCNEGYARDRNNICIPIEKCKANVCRKNEVFDNCANGGCHRRKCSELVDPIICRDPIICIGDCVCVIGYLRDENGVCIPQSKCRLNCTGPNEFFACGGACDNVCLTLNEQNQTNCPIVNIQCNPMCYCEKEFARDENGICIPIKKCPPSRCGPNQRYVENPSSICEPQYCSELGLPLDCETVDKGTTTPMCEQTTPPPACLCKLGYVRDKDGNCIPKSECPSSCRG